MPEAVDAHSRCFSETLADRRSPICRIASQSPLGPPPTRTGPVDRGAAASGLDCLKLRAWAVLGDVPQMMRTLVLADRLVAWSHLFPSPRDLRRQDFRCWTTNYPPAFIGLVPEPLDHDHGGVRFTAYACDHCWCGRPALLCDLLHDEGLFGRCALTSVARPKHIDG